MLKDNQVAEASGVEVCRLEGEPGIVYIVLNHNESPVSFRLAIRETTGNWFDLNSDAPITLDDVIDLPPLGVLAFAQRVREAP